MTGPGNSPDRAGSPVREGVADSLAAWRVALASLLLIACAMGVVYLLWSNVKTISDDMGWSRGTTSAAYALEMLGTGIGGILMGRLADRIGAARVAFVGALAIVAGSLLLTRIESAWQFCLIFGLVIGFLGNAALFAPLIATATRWFERHRGLAVAVVASGQGLAGAVWPMVFDLLIAAHGWRGALLIYGLIAAVAMPPLVLLLRGQPPGWAALQASQRALGAAGRRFAVGPGNLPLALLCAAIVCCCTSMSMPLLHLASHARDLGYSSTQGASLLAWIMALSLVGRLGLGYFADRIGTFRAMMFASAAQGAGVFLMAPFDALAVLYAGATLFGLGFGGLVPIYAVVLRNVYPAHAIGWRVGAIFLFGALGMAFGGQFAGSLFDWTATYRWAFLAGAAFNAFNLLLLVTVRAVTRHPLPARPLTSPGP